MDRSRQRRAVVPRPEIDPRLVERLPPGQIVAKRWPVLHAGEVPAFDPETWELRVFGLVRRPLALSWDAFCLLPQSTVNADLHCVTRWSLMDNRWRGVPFALLLEQADVRPEASFAVLHGEGDYTANVPLRALLDPAALVAVANHDESLQPEYGYPARAIVPSRYAWKSVKWLRGIELVAEDRPGFWESYGYHDNADPWREERFRDENGPPAPNSGGESTNAQANSV